MGVYNKKGNWYIDYYVDGKRKREKIGPSKKLAETVLKKRKIQIAEGKFLDIKKEERIKFSDFSDEFLGIYSKANKKSWQRDEDCINSFKRHFEGKYLHEINTKDIEKYKIERIKKVCKSTVNRELSCLKTLMNKAVEWEKLITNPAKKIKKFKVQNKRTRYLEAYEINRLIDCCGISIRPIVVTAVNTGMRKHELLDLEWKDVDFGNGIIYIRNTKNSEVRGIPMNDTVKGLLSSLRGKVFSKYVFCKTDGTPFRSVKTAFSTALRKADIKDFTFHDLRHTFASHLVMNNTDLKTVQELLGHKSIEMTMRYSHLSASHKKRAVNRLAFQIDTIWTPEDKKEKEETNVLFKQLAIK